MTTRGMAICLTLVAGLLPACGEDGGVDPRLDFPLKLVRVDELGLAFADSSINTSVFREQSILRFAKDGYLVALYGAEGVLELTVVVDGVVTKRHTIEPRIPDNLLGDGHASISLGLSDDGYLHVIYGAHATSPFYAWIPIEQVVAGAPDQQFFADRWSLQMTYPQLYEVGPELELWYRSDPDSEIHRARYVVVNGQPEFRPERVLLPGDAVSVYMNQLAIGNGQSALTWMYRMPTGDGEVLNEGIYALFSEVQPGPWRAPSGEVVSLPVARAENLRVLRVPKDRHLLNQTGSALGSGGTLYLTYYARDPSGHFQIWLAASRPGEAWRHWKVTANERDYDLTGAGTLVLPLSRPRLHVSDSFAHVFYREGERLKIAHVALGLGSDVVFRQCFDIGDLGAWEPTTSREFWVEEGKVYLLVQAVRQAPLDQASPGDPSPARVLVFEDGESGYTGPAADTDCKKLFGFL